MAYTIKMSYNFVSNMNTSEDSELKVYVENVLKLQRKYGWMMDSYVLVSSSLLELYTVNISGFTSNCTVTNTS